MAAEFRCEKCRKLLTAEARQGQQVVCPHCGTRVEIALPPAAKQQALSDADSTPADPGRGPGEPDPQGQQRPPRVDPTEAVMATVMPWVISLTFHVGLALIMMFVAMIVIGNTYPEQITVPEAVFSQTPGGVMNPAERQQQLQTPKPQPSGRQRYARSESKIDTGKTAQKIKLISAGPGSGAGIPFGLDSGGDTSVRSSFYGSGGNAHHIVYVVDRSGSMVMSFDLVRQEMLRSISRLVPPQDFHVILFTSGEPLETQPSKLVPANHDNKIRVAKFLSEIRAQGQTDPSAAMARALAVLAKSNRLPGKLIYLLTDGVFADNEKVLEVIRQANAGRKVLINTYLYGHLPPKAVAVMKQIAKENGGRYRYIPSND